MSLVLSSKTSSKRALFTSFEVASKLADVASSTFVFNSSFLFSGNVEASILSLRAFLLAASSAWALISFLASSLISLIFSSVVAFANWSFNSCFLAGSVIWSTNDSASFLFNSRIFSGVWSLFNSASTSDFVVSKLADVASSTFAFNSSFFFQVM
ncbi:hypothetical protein [Mycoplasmopsis canis]|uniref:hypothetical protein n=1 Tax=Mycoplasmopsis canis TaxID=29555 RepID=UPI0002DD8F2A|nr:hypothetical protein [Mycoplasmopsis canis]